MLNVYIYRVCEQAVYCIFYLAMRLVSLFLPTVAAVLRYPDIDWELRHKPLTVEECIKQAPQQGMSIAKRCLDQLRYQLLADADCTQIVPAFWMHISILEGWRTNTTCGDAITLFSRLWDLGMGSLLRGDQLFDRERTSEYFRWFVNNQSKTPDLSPLTHREEFDPYLVYIADTPLTILTEHVDRMKSLLHHTPHGSPTLLLRLAQQISLQTQYMIENLAVAQMVNHATAQLQDELGYMPKDLSDEERAKKQQFKDSTFGPGLHIKWRDIGTKRWDVLRYLLNFLTNKNKEKGIADKLQIVEVGVESANTSVRLLNADGSPEHHYHDGEKHVRMHIGVDPYFDDDARWQRALNRVHNFRGRSTILRTTSGTAADMVADHSMDMIFLDARHDPAAVLQDISWWHRKVKPGGILCGHDFSWLYPGVAMAVNQMTGRIRYLLKKCEFFGFQPMQLKMLFKKCKFFIRLMQLKIIEVESARSSQRSV